MTLQPEAFAPPSRVTPENFSGGVPLDASSDSGVECDTPNHYVPQQTPNPAVS